MSYRNKGGLKAPSSCYILVGFPHHRRENHST